MATFAIDSSIAAAWCFPGEQTPYTSSVLRALATPVEAAAPSLWAYEIHNSILMGLRRKRIDQTHADEFLGTLRCFPIRLREPASFDFVFSLANRHGLTVYDAAYLELALRERLPLASLDNALVRAAGQCGVAVFSPESRKKLLLDLLGRGLFFRLRVVIRVIVRVFAVQLTATGAVHDRAEHVVFA